MENPPPVDELTPIENAILAGRKIDAIKLYRDQTSAGLAEAKAAVDDMEARLRIEAPERFVKGAGKSGCTVTVGVFVIATVSAWIILF
jgi:ribosomal protein L7/L12